MNSSLSTYDVVAREYYDPRLHPTCANFRELSLRSFQENLRIKKIYDHLHSGKLLETGAGKSLVAEQLAKTNFALDNLTLQDQSEEMLSHSIRWQNQINGMLISDARDVPVASGEYNTVLSFLLDPYNDPNLWNEMNRVLAAGGLWIFTTPSFDWANQFRQKSSQTLSRFVLGSGEEIDLPSYVYPVHKMINLLKKKGFKLEAFRGLSLLEIRGRISKKLVTKSPLNSVVDSYVFRKVK